MTKPLNLRACVGAVIVASFAALSTAAAAHPHFRFDYRLEALLAEGMGAAGVERLRVHWRIDPAASAQIRAAADTNASGALEPEELAAFARGNERLLRPMRYFLQVSDPAAPTEAEPLAFEPSVPLSATDGEAGVELSFEVRFAAPLPARFSVRFFDPTWNVALQPQAPVLATHADGACFAAPRMEERTTVGWGVQPVEVIEFRCDAADTVRPVASSMP